MLAYAATFALLTLRPPPLVLADDATPALYTRAPLPLVLAVILLPLSTPGLLQSPASSFEKF